MTEQIEQLKKIEGVDITYVNMHPHNGFIHFWYKNYSFSYTNTVSAPKSLQSSPLNVSRDMGFFRWIGSYYKLPTGLKHRLPPVGSRSTVYDVECETLVISEPILNQMVSEVGRIETLFEGWKKRQ